MSKQNPLTATPSPETARIESNSDTEEPETRGKHWDYEENGPNRWASLNPENKLCGDGKNQSPIDITNVESAELAEVKLNFPHAEFADAGNENAAEDFAEAAFDHQDQADEYAGSTLDGGMDDYAGFDATTDVADYSMDTGDAGINDFDYSDE
ncbi:MAG: hypothetical protein ACK5NT_04895 [Pyrinomonadaceae bacterium]